MRKPASSIALVVPLLFGCAAYRFELDGQLTSRPVIDWVGEEPVDGDSFTYTLDFDPNRQPVQMVQLLDVTQDE